MKNETRNNPTVLLHLRDALVQRHPEMASALAQVIDSVCLRHIQQVRAQIHSASGLSDLAVLDDLNPVLRGIFAAFAEGDVTSIETIGPAHAAAREGHGFNLAEVIGEYVLLRRNLKELVAEQLKRPFTMDEEESFQSAIDAASSAATISFVAQREARMRLEITALSDYLSSLAHDLRNEINGSMLAMTLVEEAGNAQPGGDAGYTVERIRSLMIEISACRNSMESSVSSMTRLLEAESLRNQTSSFERETAILPLMQGIARSADRMEQRQSSVQGRLAGSRILIDCVDGISFKTDPDLLSTVLSNLIGNAVKFAPVGPIRFIARIEGECCQFTVADWGPGMTREQVDKLFQRFERAGRCDRAGMGIGLFLVRRAATLLNATVSVESEPDRGSSFMVTVPVK